MIIIGLLVLIAAMADIISPFSPTLAVLEYAEKPSGFVGNVLLLKTLQMNLSLMYYLYKPLKYIKIASNTLILKD